MGTNIYFTLPISHVTMWDFVFFALVCNYYRKRNWFISTIIGDKSTDSLRILYAGIFLSLHTDHCFDLVNSALGVNTDAKGTHWGCNPALDKTMLFELALCRLLSQSTGVHNEAMINRQQQPKSPVYHCISDVLLLWYLRKS